MTAATTKLLARVFCDILVGEPGVIRAAREGHGIGDDTRRALCGRPKSHPARQRR
jgi:hypothetical protein